MSGHVGIAPYIVDGAEEHQAEFTLPEVVDRSPYPLEHLGELLGGAAEAIASDIQAPPEIAAHSILATAAYAAQDKANCTIDGRDIPLSLFLLTVAESGDRKSACDKVASAPLLAWQKTKIAAHVAALERYNAETAIYESEYRAALSGKKSAAAKEAALEELTPPEPPIQPLVLCQEPTLEGLQKSFRVGRPSQALFNDEGAQFMGGHGMNSENIGKTISGLSKYWDGAPIIRTRAAAGESAAMFDRRLSIHLLLQPRFAGEMLANPLLMEQGLLARFLIADSESMAGYRPYQGKDASKNPNVLLFHKRITALLDQEPETEAGGGLKLPNLKLTPDAYRYWVAAYNNIEASLRAGGLFERIRPVAAKSGENAMRIAGVFAVIEGGREITERQIYRAWNLAVYYLQNALRTAQLNEANQAERDAVEILQWITEKANGRAHIDVMQKRMAPARLRKSVAFIRAVMSMLVKAGKARVMEENSRGAPCAWEVIK